MDKKPVKISNAINLNEIFDNPDEISPWREECNQDLLIERLSKAYYKGMRDATNYFTVDMKDINVYITDGEGNLPTISILGNSDYEEDKLIGDLESMLFNAWHEVFRFGWWEIVDD